ncbi:MAG TPA: tetratricopeptide repeat protein [Terriglobia bacterium]|nr:tetratricopeptide repeat protein [Terriglobia bacterium]
MQTLYARRLWQQIADLPVAAGEPPEVDYYRGMALARLERWQEARQAFLDGQRKAPRDKRFPEELAGVAFKRGNLPAAARHLRRALHVDPEDTYAANFLATVYLLEGNLDAALRCWNPIGKPRIEDIRMDPQPSLDPILLDRAFAFSPASVLRLPDLLTTEARLDGLGVFPQYQISLAPAPGRDGAFDAVLQTRTRQGWGDSKWQGLLSLLRGAPYDTLYPEWFNIKGSAINFASLVRWDPQKRRAMASLSGPFSSSARWRYQLHVDGRDENWDVAPAFYGPGPALNGLKVDRLEAGAEVQFLASGRWSWETGLDASERHFARLPASFNSSGAGALFDSGLLLGYHSQINAVLLRIPERRLRVESSLRGEVGRLFAPAVDPYARFQTSLTADWLPAAQDDRDELSFRARAGETFGDIPFDELFMLGIERDNDLWLRGHVGTANGRKGSAPLGRNFVLTNADYTHVVYQDGLVKLKLGPFLDSGRINDPSDLFGSRAWLWDPGIELRLTVLGGTEILFTYGRDLRGGRNAFYATSPQ